MCGITVLVFAAQALANVPRAAADFSRIPLLASIDRPEQLGTDTIADQYEARVVRHDMTDMYTKGKTPQTPAEAETWSKEESSPYPPVTLLTLAALSAVGDRIGVGLYGMVAGLAVVFVGASFWCFWRTRWYLFPLIYLNGQYLAERFFHVQDGSYLIMLLLVTGALLISARLPGMSALLMAIGASAKLSPVFYGVTLRREPGRFTTFIAVVSAGLVLPFLVWDNYASIFVYNSATKGDWLSAAGGGLVGLIFAAGVLAGQSRGRLRIEDLIGWSLVPVAALLAFKMNAARHLLLALLVPDPRAVRNLALVAGLAAEAWIPNVGPNGVLPMVCVVLAVGLIIQLRQPAEPRV